MTFRIINTSQLALEPVNSDRQVLKRLSPLSPAIEPEPVYEPAMSDIQRNRMEMLAIYDAPHNLPVSQFAKLAGKSRDQINREIKAGKLLTLNIGNRWQHIPDWQLEPIKHRLVYDLPKQAAGIETLALS